MMMILILLAMLIWVHVSKRQEAGDDCSYRFILHIFMGHAWDGEEQADIYFI